MFIGHDLGTGSDKAVLVDATGRLLAEASASYPLDRPSPHRAEQDPEHWWRAVAEATRALLKIASVSPEAIRGVGFAGQMLALVPMDASGTPTRKALSWLDARAEVEARRLTRRLGGERVVSLLAGGSPSAKDLLPKMAWIAHHEPDIFAGTRAFGDATSYLVARATGRVCIDPTAAGGTGIFDVKRRRWSRWLARLADFDLSKMPEVVECASVAGELNAKAASELDLAPGTKVAMGMADIPAAAVGAGASAPGQAHLYLGTSAWIGVTHHAPRAMPRTGIAAVPAAALGTSLSIGEMETAGACRAWAKALLGVDEDELDRLASEAKPASDGLLFAPHLFGERAPYSDAALRGAFVGLSLEHGRPELARAVLEGVALNLRGIFDAMSSLGDLAPQLRVVGGGARSDTWLAILADVLGTRLTRMKRPELAGAVGVALTAAVAVGALPDMKAISGKLAVDRDFDPTEGSRAAYDEALARLTALRPALSRDARTHA